MATINDSLYSALTSLGLGEQTTETSSSDTLGQEDFLNLMITQLQNQDPFSPMENGDFIAQMAQFSSVAGLAELQDSFESLATSLQSNQALQASSLVGRTVLVSSSIGVLPEEGDLTGSVDLPGSTTNLTVTIQDSTGQVMRTLELGPNEAGEVYFSWDGLTEDGTSANPGKYYISATTDYQGTTYALETMINASVESVTLGQSGSEMTLNLADGNTVSLSQVVEIR